MTEAESNRLADRIAARLLQPSDAVPLAKEASLADAVTALNAHTTALALLHTDNAAIIALLTTIAANTTP